MQPDTSTEHSSANYILWKKAMVMSAWAHLLKGLGWQWVGHFSPLLYEFDEKQSHHPIRLSFLVMKLFSVLTGSHQSRDATIESLCINEWEQIKSQGSTGLPQGPLCEVWRMNMACLRIHTLKEREINSAVIIPIALLSWDSALWTPLPSQTY